MVGGALPALATLIVGWQNWRLTRLNAELTARNLKLAEQKEEREGRKAATDAWKDAAEGREARLVDLEKEKADLEERSKAALEQSREEAEILREGVEIYRTGYNTERQRAAAMLEGFKTTRDALHRSGLLMLAWYDAFQRGQRLRRIQQRVLNDKVEEIIKDVCELLKVKPVDVYAALQSEEAPSGRLFVAAVLVQTLENIRGEVTIQFYAPLQNVFLGAKVSDLIRTNNKLTFEEIAPKYSELLDQDTKELFEDYPPDVVEASKGDDEDDDARVTSNPDS